MTKKEELEAQGYKTYENEDIQVFWKPRICQQALSLRSGITFRGAGRPHLVQVCWYFGAGRFLGEGPAPQIGFLWPVMAPVCALLSDLRRPPNVADSTFGTFRLLRRCGTDWITMANLVSLHR